MIRFIAALVLAATGFVVATPARAQSDATAPEVFVASDGAVVVLPPALSDVLSSEAGNAADVSRTEERSRSNRTEPSERQLAGPVFSEGARKSAAGRSATSVVLAPRQANRVASCTGCGTEQQAPVEHNSSNAWHALPYNFVNPYTLARSRSPAFSTAGTRTLLDSPKPSDAKRSLSAEPIAEVRSASRSGEKRSNAVDTKTPVGSPNRPEKKQVSSSLPDKKHRATAHEMGLVRSSGRADVTRSSAFAEASIRSSPGNAASGVGKVPEPEMWFLTLLGVLGASFLRRRRSRS